MSTDQRQPNLLDDDAVVQNFTAAVAALCEQGLKFARHENPNLYGQANKMIAAGIARFQLRVDFGQKPRTTGYVIDAGGEPVLQMFQINGAVESDAGKVLQ